MTKFKKTSGLIAVALAAGLAFEGASALVKDVAFAKAEQQASSTRQELQSVQDLSTVFRNVGKVVEPSVVQIEVRKTVRTAGLGGGGGGQLDPQLRKFFHDRGMTLPDGSDGGKGDDDNDEQQPAPGESDGGLQEVGTGSGVIMEVDGGTVYILTNNHVAGGAEDLVVTLADGRVIKGGKTIGADPKSDLAVVRIKADRVMPAVWGDSDQLSRGDWVLAFGSPFGYVGSMTHGIVSALHRQAGILGKQGYENFIQVDAPINPGNSGGPLVNMHGEVVGINTAIASKSGGFQGIGFAIPSDQAKEIYKALKEKGKVTRGYLGVEIQDVARETVAERAPGYTGDSGVSVHGVTRGSPALGKLQAGDVITGMNGKPVDNMQELRGQVAMVPPGEDAKLKVFRDGKTTEVDVKVGEQPENMALAGGNLAPPEAQRQYGNTAASKAFGLHLSDVTDEMNQKFKLGEVKAGAVVTSVTPGSLAYKAGVQVGDVVTKVGTTAVTTASEAADALGKQDAAKGVRLFLSNADGSRFVFLQQE